MSGSTTLTIQPVSTATETAAATTSMKSRVDGAAPSRRITDADGTTGPALRQRAELIRRPEVEEAARA
jgi:hypothetical protein